MINRAIAPEFGSIDNIILHEPQTVILDNNIILNIINGGTEDLVKIEFIFPAGSWNEPSPLVAAATGSMLNEGTSKYSGAQIAERIDAFGAFFEVEVTPDYSSLVLYSLNNHLESVLPIIKEILTESNLPENELNTYKQNKKQKLLINQERVDYLCRAHFNEILFGKYHPYGHVATVENFDTLKREDLVRFFNTHYSALHCKIIASGNVTDHTTKCLNHYLGFHDWDKEPATIQAFHSANSAVEKKIFIKKEAALQSAIRIGKKLFTREHKDYHGMLVLNTVLGGYFGSRLMANIREEKGYTYGIGSAAASMLKEGYFVIATEVGTKVCNDAIKEIYLEIDRLRSQLIPESELETVRSYMLGSFLRSIDGPFELADKFKNIMLHGLRYDYYQNFLKTVRTISPAELQNLAQTYLQEDSLYELVVGDR
jgi:zinc protease